MAFKKPKQQVYVRLGCVFCLISENTWETHVDKLHKPQKKKRKEESSIDAENRLFILVHSVMQY